MAHVKDVYTFLHDANARNDGRILQLRAQHGLEGYGFFFCLIELMRESTDYKLREKFCDGYALQLGLEPTKFKALFDSCVSADLLTVENGEIFSAAFLRRMELYDQKRSILRANAQQPRSKRLANAKQKQSRSRASVYIEQEQEQECTDRKDGSGKETKPEPVAIGDHFCAPRVRLDALKTEWGAAKIDYYVAAFNDYIAQNPTRKRNYRDHIATIRNWERRDASELRGFHAVKPNPVPQKKNTAWRSASDETRETLRLALMTPEDQ